MYHAVAEVVSHWPLAIESQVQSKTSPCGGQSGTWTGWVLRLSPVCIIPPVLRTHPIICHQCCKISASDSIM